MSKPYFGNPSNLCFGTSLANALVELDDFETARKVYEDYPQHPLFDRSKTINLGISPQMVRELTRGKYFGCLYAPTHWIDNFETFTRAEFGDQADKLVGLIREELSAGNILPIPKKGNYKTPILMFIYNPVTLSRHVITSTLNGRQFINNGFLISDFPHGFDLTAGLEIYSSLGLIPHG